jgi:hypothetical protein
MPLEWKDDAVTSVSGVTSAQELFRPPFFGRASGIEQTAVIELLDDGQIDALLDDDGLTFLIDDVI